MPATPQGGPNQSPRETGRSEKIPWSSLAEAEMQQCLNGSFLALLTLIWGSGSEKVFTVSLVLLFLPVAAAVPLFCFLQGLEILCIIFTVFFVRCVASVLEGQRLKLICELMRTPVSKAKAVGWGISIVHHGEGLYGFVGGEHVLF